MLHEVVRENLETFLAQARARTEHGFGVPRLLDEEFRAFIRSGVINHGFARVRLADVLPRVLRRLLVQAPRRVPVMFGAARRCVCHPPGGRGLPLDTDADVDPLTFPRRLRFALAKDARLLTTILGIWHRALSSFYRLIASKEGFRATRTGAVTFVHRFAWRACSSGSSAA